MLGREHLGKVSKKFIGNFYFWEITLKYLSARMSAMPSPDKNEPSKITGSRVVGGNYTRHEQREFTCSAVQFGRQKYGLFCKTRLPVSFVMSKFQKHTAPLRKPTKNKEFCGGLWCGVGCTALFPSVARLKHLSMAHDSMNAFYLFIFESFVNKTSKRSF